LQLVPPFLGHAKAGPELEVPRISSSVSIVTYQAFCFITGFSTHSILSASI
jgi:hypothetical protein